MEQLFKQNKYTTWYYNIITIARSHNRKKGDGGYYEVHHIVPRAFGGDNKNTNLVLLTAREHYLCHLLLPKMMSKPMDISKMVYAFFRFKGKCKNSKMFDKFRTAYGKLTTGENNAFYGKKHTAETLEKMSGTNHPMFNKKHRPESIEKMRRSKIGKMAGPNNGMYGKKHTAEWCANHSADLSGENHFNYGKPAFTKGRIWMNNTKKSKMIKPEFVNEMTGQGWAFGRLPK